MTHSSPRLSRMTSHPQTGEFSLYTAKEMNYVENDARQYVIIYCNKVYFLLYSKTSVYSTKTVRSSPDL